MQQEDKEKYGNVLVSLTRYMIVVVCLFVITAICALILVLNPGRTDAEAPEPVKNEIEVKAKENWWNPPDIETISDQAQRKQVSYGKNLVAHTANYFGPKGSIAQSTNGLNCQNCHLSAGTVVFGNNYGSVAATYPKFRPRSGSIESISKRVNDCFERSLNGETLDTTSAEMQAIIAYIKFLGSNVAKGNKAAGSGLKEIAFLSRAANPANGKTIYISKCQSCHLEQGQGTLNASQNEYTYPALWGPQSYNDGAGLYRIINLAKFVKYNMPLGASHDSPQLTDEEAWDVAAFINSQPRPKKDIHADWPDVSKKPIDHPFGPFADAFSETQHKYGPFGPIEAAQKKK
jgi:thiosulfate dehydrogenase